MDLNCTTRVSDDMQYPSSSIEATTSLNGLRELTDLIVNPVFFAHNVLPPDITNTLDFFNSSSFIQAIKENWQDILKHNPSLLAMVTVGIAVAVLLPISGLIAVCTYCCSKKTGTVYKKGRAYLVLEGLAYFILFTITWLGVAWLIKSGLVFQNEINQLPATFDGYIQYLFFLKLTTYF